MGQPVKLSDGLVDDARAVIPFSQRSSAGQIEFWAGLGKSIEPLLRGDRALALQMAGGELQLSRLMAEVETARGRKRLEATSESHLLIGTGPTSEVDRYRPISPERFGPSDPDPVTVAGRWPPGDLGLPTRPDGPGAGGLDSGRRTVDNQRPRIGSDPILPSWLVRQRHWHERTRTGTPRGPTAGRRTAGVLRGSSPDRSLADRCSADRCLADR